MSIKTKRLLQNIGLAVGSVIFFLFLIEASLHIFKPKEIHLRILSQYDPILGFRLRPNYQLTVNRLGYIAEVKTNSLGLRDREFQIPKPKNTFRILVLGDSFTFGLGIPVEDSYPKILEKILNDHLSPKTGIQYEVVNGGVFNYGPHQYYFYLRDNGLQLQPDLVVEGILPLNDVDDVAKGSHFNHRFAKLKEPFYLGSFLYGKYMDIAVPWFRKHGNVLPMIALDKYPPEFAQAYQKTKDYISSAAKICGENHIPMVLLVIPAGIQVDKADWEFMGIQQLYTDKLFNENMVRANAEFADFAKEQEIPYLDLLPTFRQTTTRPLFLSKDGHFTRQGCELTAQTLFSYLTTEKLIPIALNSKM